MVGSNCPFLKQKDRPSASVGMPIALALTTADIVTDGALRDANNGFWEYVISERYVNDVLNAGLVATYAYY